MDKVYLVLSSTGHVEGVYSSKKVADLHAGAISGYSEKVKVDKFPPKWVKDWASGKENEC